MIAVLAEGRVSMLFSVVQRIELGFVVLGLLVLIIRVITAEDRRSYCLLALWYALPFAIVPSFRPPHGTILISSILRRFWQLGYWPDPLRTAGHRGAANG